LRIGCVVVLVINRLAHHTFLRVAGLAAGAAAVSGAAVLVTASGYNLPFLSASANQPNAAPASPGRQAGQPSALCNDFVTHFAADLNTTQAAVNAAFQKAIGETLADQIKNGKLSQGLGAFRGALMSAAASALGISDDTLKADLGKGMTLSQIAAAQHVTEAQFRERLIAKLKPVLDAAVTSKKLTPEREQAIIKRLQTGPIPLWNRPAGNGTAAGNTPPAD
jgi:hypothetical protein